MKACIIFLVLVIVFSHMAVAQENDNCINAILLKAGNQCVIQEYSNATATAEADSVASDPACGTYAGGDVWFKAVVPASGALRVEVDNLQNATPPSFTLYSGRCGNFTEVVCVRNDHKKTVYQPSLAEDTVYIRVYSYFSEKGGSFSLCVFEPQIPQNDLCENALLLEVGESCRLDTLSNAYAEPSCGFYQGGDIWFKAVMPGSGLLRINKNRISGATHPSMTIYTGSCGDFTEVLCSKNDPTETLNNPSLAGQTLYFRLYNYSNEEGASFSFCLYEEEAPENDNCENALPISVGDSCAFTTYSNRQATAQLSTTAPDPTCGAYQGGDVWFKAVLPASGLMHIETNNLEGATEKSVIIYSGVCGDFTEVACGELTSSLLLQQPDLAGDTVYLRMYSYGSEEGGEFGLCVYDPPVCIPDRVDAGQVVLCKGESYQFGTQTIIGPGDYSELFQNSQGCDSLVTLSVIVNEVNTTVIQDGETLTAQAAEASYQWISCTDGNIPVAGETGQTFTASSAGDYAVIITENSCTDTSACYSITVVGVTDEDHSELILFPNPVGEVLHIKLPRPYEDAWVEIIDMKGQIIKTEHLQGKSMTTLDMSMIPSGGYVVKIHTKEGMTFMKMLKE